jgi:hypothetical protein
METVRSPERSTGRESRSLVLATVGAAGIVITMILQWLLVTGALTFEEQILPVAVGLWMVGAWMVGTGLLARRVGGLPHRLRNGVLGASYVGFPIWALDVGRWLLRAGR